MPRAQGCKAIKAAETRRLQLGGGEAPKSAAEGVPPLSLRGALGAAEPVAKQRAELGGLEALVLALSRLWSGRGWHVSAVDIESSQVDLLGMKGGRW
eukprot:CAMPEP_0172604374 /NCGR_PEP_ID=MMETSP1068-20121228/24622_1 /TAXON_ID=35684 /ORGANISM="Pseudopedinella elastica, Strain CCMP716" /LENGTH=96 /DNA_ID=CAMNT_0013406419 /DNA_START=280 /DNA_END=570 /DNA_ORIENTATION=-